MLTKQTRDEEERAFDDCFDRRTGMIRDGVSRVTVPIKLIDSAGAPKPKRPDYYVRVERDVSLDGGEYVRRRPKKVQYRDPEGDQEGTAELEDRQPGFATRDSAVRAVLDDCYSAYDEAISSAWQNKPTMQTQPLEALTGQGSHGQRGPRLGSACTVKFGGGKYGAEGSPGTWKLIDDQMVCVADSHDAERGRDAAPLRDAYTEYDQNLRDAWRRGHDD